MVHRREIDGRELVFGNQGDLYRRAMTWWDHDTGSVWSQPRGEAILGPLTGARLELLPSTLTTWSRWRTDHPDTLALDAQGVPTYFELDDMLVVVEFGDEATGYPVPALRAEGVVNDVVGGVPVAVLTGAEGDERPAVFSRRLDDGVARLRLDGDRLVDAELDAAWDATSGLRLEGPAALGDLDPLAAFTVFPADFPSFFPDGRVWSP
jgi:hypothetical protein